MKKKSIQIVEDINWIVVSGAREHNLKNINVAIPKEKLTVITGPSGSGKSSLALDILYTEGKRRYMESLSSYARQFLGVAGKPDVDTITGLCPSIAIEQKTVGSNPRSTVGTITELYDYLRVLYARIGKVHCPSCGKPIQTASSESIVEMIVHEFEHNTITVAAPIAHEKKGEFFNELTHLFNAGFYRFIIDGTLYKFSSIDDIKKLGLKKTIKHSIDLLIDQIDITASDKSRITESIETAFKHARGIVKVIVNSSVHYYSSQRMCVTCGESIPELEPRFFSFNSPLGACTGCQGLGTIQEWPWYDDEDAWESEHPTFFGPLYAIEKTCDMCLGKRLNKYALAVTVSGFSIVDVCDLSIKQLREFFNNILLDALSKEIAQTLITEIINRLTFLYDVGLGYLTLNRPARTLSGGEGQRIRLATQIGSALSGVLYILDEPSIGLHQRDNDRLIETLKRLRDLGNTLVVVEHDTDTMKQADYIIDMGPGAGILGGHITAVGTPQEIMKNPKSLTGSFLSEQRTIQIPDTIREPQGYLVLQHAGKNNLRDLTVRFPLKVLCGISGVSGSGKSTLIMQELVPHMQRELGAIRVHNKSNSDLEGAAQIENMVVIDQSPIGRTPRSNPATYLGVFDDIRKLFASLPESNVRGYTPGRFSFNVAEGRCFECRGDGVVKIEMHFLPEVIIECKTCKGKRYNKQTLDIIYKEKNIADVLHMTAYEALQFFVSHKSIAKRLQLMCDVGLDYVQLSQAATTLSGGEAQRIKLVDELAKRGQNTLYILDEPTTGLHASDIERLLLVLNKLVDKGNSMIIIEHNLDVLKTVDYLIDLGPEGGDEGGMIIAQGTPTQVAMNQQSYTGYYLRPLLKKGISDKYTKYIDK